MRKPVRSFTSVPEQPNNTVIIFLQPNVREKNKSEPIPEYTDDQEHLQKMNEHTTSFSAAFAVIKQDT